jgi:biopolymer transport protein ExbD
MKLKRFDSMNVVPFIDVMLVLLAMVLMVSTFINQNQIQIELELPQASSQQKLSKEEGSTISVTANNEIIVDKKTMNLEEAKAYLIALPLNTPIQFHSDKNSYFGIFVQLTDALKTHGHENIQIITENEK